MEVCRLTDSAPWVEHPPAEGAHIKTIVTRKDDGLDVTCMLVAIPAGKEVGEHVHPGRNDILCLEKRHAKKIEERAGLSPYTGVHSAFPGQGRSVRSIAPECDATRVALLCGGHGGDLSGAAGPGNQGGGKILLGDGYIRTREKVVLDN